MEEFRSTEILDKEIQDDARKKAEKLIKKAQIDGKHILEDANKQLELFRSEKNAEYSSRIETYCKNLNATLPLEKERFFISFENQAITEVIQDYVKSLNGDKKISLLKELLMQYKEILSNKKLNCFYFALKESEAKKIIESVLSKGCVKSFSPFNSNLYQNEIIPFDIDCGFFIETEDNLIRCRVTISELVASLLDNHRFELANTLFKGRIKQ